MNILEFASNLFVRFRYPVSLPTEVANALGVEITNHVSFPEMLQLLTSPQCKPTKLQRLMPRDKAERAFAGALRKEALGHCTLFSYYFPGGWMAFELHFDDASLLRRVYIHHKQIPHPRGFELPLPTN
jgi:hypothetical protein